MARRQVGVFTAKRRAHPFRWLLWIVLGIVGFCSIHTAVDNGRIVVKTQKVWVANLPKALEGFTVLHISDLNAKRFGPNQKQLAGMLKGKKYNAVCLTGDMVGKKGDTAPFYELLSALDTARPVFFIAGDSDPAPVGERPQGYYTVLADWVAGANTRGATFLGAPASVTVGGSTVWFTDATQLALDLDTAAAAYSASGTPVNAYWAEVIQKTKEARARMQDADLHITLSHLPLMPDLVLRMQSMGGASDSFLRTVDLILAGGTAGGQWRVPLIGPVWANGWFPEDRFTQGFRQAGGLPEYISGGLHVSSQSPLPGFRLFNTPEMTLITFTSFMDDGVLPE